MADETPEVPFIEPSGVSHLDMIAIQLNEMYISLQRGGFTQPEALELIGIVMSNGIGYEPPEQPEDEEDEIDLLNDFNDEDGDDFI